MSLRRRWQPNPDPHPLEPIVRAVFREHPTYSTSGGLPDDIRDRH
jgi:hypothetical protein